MIYLSVIVPAFNLEYYISETLNSILLQTFKDFEVLVVDDGSLDNTVNIIKEYCKKDSRIKLLKNTRTKGAAGARNTGIYAAKGEWIAFLDGDDIWVSDAIEVRLNCLKIFPKTEFITADISSFTGTINQAEPSRAESNEDWKLCFGKAMATETSICIENPIITFLRSVVVLTDTVCIKTALLQKVGGFDESLPAFEDIQCWMKVACHTDALVFAPKTIAFYRQREGSLMHSGNAVHHYAPQAYLKLLVDPYFEEYKQELKDNIYDFNLQNCFFYRKSRNYKQAILWGIKGVYWQPFSFIAWKNFIASCLFR